MPLDGVITDADSEDSIEDCSDSMPPNECERAVHIIRGGESMEGFEFLNTAVGLEYCADDEDIYREVLEGYVEEDRRSELEALLAKEDWAEYRVIVHAIKSTSLTIGAEELSAKAKALELAAADGDGSFVKANHQEMMNMYTDILTKIQGAL